MKDMDNLMDYSLGFLDGVKQGTPGFLKELGASVSYVLKEYIDSNARVNPEMLHHVYEWNQAGSPDSRLFDIEYSLNGFGLSFSSTFRQSNSIKDGSNVPFYNKAKIMEDGIPVTIIPKKRVLAFEENGETVFTSQPVRVSNPGGNVQGEYQRVFDSFFTRYFTQAFISSSGLSTYLSNPVDFYKNFRAGKGGGRSKGISTGRAWIQGALN